MGFTNLDYFLKYFNVLKLMYELFNIPSTYCSGVGRGCSGLKPEDHRRVTYFMRDDVFYASVTCTDGYFLSDVDDDEVLRTGSRFAAFQKSIVIVCIDTAWNQSVPGCAGKKKIWELGGHMESLCSSFKS